MSALLLVGFHREKVSEVVEENNSSEFGFGLKIFLLDLFWASAHLTKV
jgi:hypothetical protein